MSADDSWKGREVESPEDSPPEGRSLLEVHSERNPTLETTSDYVCGSTHNNGVNLRLAQACITETVRSDERQNERTFPQVAGDLDSVGLLFEGCIREVSHLEAQREELIQELQLLQQPMRRAVGALRAECGRVRQLLTLVELDYMDLQEQVQQVKRKLFVTARDCIQSQITLAAEQYNVAQFAVTQGELQAQIQNLTEEAAQLREAQQNQMNILMDQSRTRSRPRAMSDLSHCRRASQSLQRRLSGSMRALEGWYEPRLLALLKRMQGGEEALRRTREQGNDLRARLEPLREERQRLELQRDCLEERRALMESERKESVAQNKETVEELEETMADLKLELEVLKKSKTNMEKLKNDLLREVDFQRGGHVTCEPVEEGDG